MDTSKFMNKKYGLIAVVAILVIWGIASYNGLVNKDETVTKAWANVETSYQRRLDLIDNLVSTVKGYMKYESETLKEVIEMRSHAPKITLNADSLTEENIKMYKDAQEKWQPEYESSLSRLIAVSESYPELKADNIFMNLQVTIEGTENRINEARKEYNEAVKEYNVSVRRFPSNIIANICGFEKKVPFQAAEGAEKAPDLKGAFDK